jgi:hypothetical protein
VTTDKSGRDDLLNIECSREGDFYGAVFAVGRRGESPVWTLQLEFTSLTYKRHTD